MSLGLMEGSVVDTSDPQQMGRVKIWVPGLDGDMYNIDDLPWATYMSPFAGQTRDYPAGPGNTKTSGFASYGFWAVPKAGALVVVGFLYDDPNRRVYMGSYFRDHGNRSLPVGRNRSDLAQAPISDTFEPMEPQTTNLKTQFNGKLDAPEAKTRGTYERAVAQDKTDKDGTEGYQVGLVDVKDDKGSPLYESQTYVLATPGRHAIIMQDNPATGRVRIKTAAGHQIIMDDANERIYVSTAKGASWFEMDQDGRIHVYGADSVSMSAGGSFNLTAVGDINMAAGGNVNMQAGAAMRLAACAPLSISGVGVHLESSAAFNILAAGDLLQTGSNIHLNGPGAAPADCPTAPSTIPSHEPWERAASKTTRNKNWQA
jgi:Type VI secretion system/phage-baseplate injector OB domain